MKASGLPWVSSGPGGPSSGYDSVLPVQEVPLQCPIIESVSCVPCSTHTKHQMQAPL